ncbi:MAG TPA: hypothetical protein DCS11_03440 [Syntrophus sp. (in: bacteria)]|nr:hypothetical protein [Syntrophus sp. (in: bacteria)]
MDLEDENIEAWEFFMTFPGVMESVPFSGTLRVDYGAVRELAREVGMEHVAGLIVRLEAIARGYARK